MKPNYFWIGLILVALLAAACSPSVPMTGGLTQPSATAPMAQNATISALETLVAVIPTDTVTVTPSLFPSGTPTSTPTPAYTASITPIFSATASATVTPTFTFTPTLTPSNTPTLPPTPVITPCNRAEFVADVTIPDGTMIDAGVTFTKTWRLRNNGTCTWTPEYKLVFVSGDPLGGPDFILLGNSIIPGQTIDISVVLTAPAAAGTYKGSYKLADASGSTFGVGASGNNSIFVSIQQGIPLPSSYALVSLSTTRTGAGQDVTVYVSGFPANAQIDYRLGKLGEVYKSVYDGTVGSNGTTSKIITLPTNAAIGEYWVVQVLTTSQRDVVTVASHSIYITNTYIPYTGDVQVGLSTTQTHAGDVVTVYVRGFPANSEIDLRVGKQGEAYRVIYDGTVGTNGTTIETITIPANAVNGEYWIVQVTTTNQQNVVTFTSHSIYIIN